MLELFIPQEVLELHGWKAEALQEILVKPFVSRIIWGKKAECMIRLTYKSKSLKTYWGNTRLKGRRGALNGPIWNLYLLFFSL